MSDRAILEMLAWMLITASVITGALAACPLVGVAMLTVLLLQGGVFVLLGEVSRRHRKVYVSFFYKPRHGRRSYATGVAGRTGGS